MLNDLTKTEPRLFYNISTCHKLKYTCVFQIHQLTVGPFSRSTAKMLGCTSLISCLEFKHPMSLNFAMTSSLLKQQLNCVILLCCICCQFSHSRQYTTDEGIYQTAAAEAATALHARLVFSLLNPCMGFKEGAFPVCVLIVLGTYMYTTPWKLLHALLCLDFLVSLLPEARKVQDCTEPPFLLTELSFGR